MRNTKKDVLTIVGGFIVLLYGCFQNPASEGCRVFKTCSEVKLQRVHIQGDLNEPAFLRIFDDKIFISDFYSDHVYHLYSALDYQFEGALIRREDQAQKNNSFSINFRLPGPDTIIYRADDFIHIAYIHADNGGLTLSDVSKIELPPELASQNGFFIINDTLFTTNIGQYAVTDFQGFCLKTKNVFELGDTLVGKTSADETLASLGLKFATVKPDNSAVATIYSGKPVLRIYSLPNWELTNDCQMGDILSEKPIEYFSIRSTSDYIYALFTNTQPPSLIWDGEKWRNPDVSNEIHIWDWDGNPIKELRLNRSIYSFDVSPDNARLVAMSAVDVNHLFVAKIPWD